MEYVEVHLDDDIIEFFTVEVESNYGRQEDCFHRYTEDGKPSVFRVVKNNASSIAKAKKRLALDLITDAEIEFEKTKNRIDTLRACLD